MSQFLEYIKMAFFNILSNKVRSLLTMLGIIIGISSVILILSLGNGAQNMITGQLDSIGSGQIALVSLSDSYLINLDYVKEMQVSYNNGYCVKMKYYDAEALPIGRTQVKEFRQIFEK